jgi:hypothetical protein
MKKTEIPTERSFGLTIGAVCIAIGALFLWRANRAGWVGISSGAVLVALGLSVPRVLRPLNVAWWWLGKVLNAIVSPVVMGVIFFVVLTPVSLLLRALKRDALNLGFEPDKKTYWVERRPPGPAPDSFPRQF